MKGRISTAQLIMEPLLELYQAWLVSTIPEAG